MNLYLEDNKGLMKIIKKIMGNYSFIVVYAIYYFSYLLGYTMLVYDYPISGTIFTILRYISYAYFFVRSVYILYNLLFINNILSKFNRDLKSRIIIISLIGLALASIINLIIYKEKQMVILLCVVLSCINIDHDNMIDLTGSYQIIGIAIVTTLCIYGGISNFENIRNDGTYRYAMGFTYVTNIPSLLLSALSIYCYKKKFEISNFELCSFQMLLVYIYYVSDSRTQFILGELLMVIILLKKLKIIDRCKSLIIKVEKLFIYCFPFYPILSYIVCYLYKYGGFFYKLNNLLSGRLEQTYQYIINYGLSWFGTGVEMIGRGYSSVLELGTADFYSNFVDNSYLNILYNYGVFVLIFIVILFTVGLFYLYSRKKYYTIGLCMYYFSINLLFPNLTNICFNPMFFLLLSIPIKIVLNIDEYEIQYNYRNLGDESLETTE